MSRGEGRSNRNFLHGCCSLPSLAGACKYKNCKWAKELPSASPWGRQESGSRGSPGAVRSGDQRAHGEMTGGQGPPDCSFLQVAQIPSHGLGCTLERRRQTCICFGLVLGLLRCLLGQVLPLTESHGNKQSAPMSWANKCGQGDAPEASPRCSQHWPFGPFFSLRWLLVEYLSWCALTCAQGLSFQRAFPHLLVGPGVRAILGARPLQKCVGAAVVPQISTACDITWVS